MTFSRSAIVAIACTAGFSSVRAQPAAEVRNSGCSTAADVIGNNSGSTYIQALTALAVTNPNAGRVAAALYDDAQVDREITFFVPSDAALGRSLDDLTDTDIINVLLTHVADGAYNTNQFSDAGQVSALSGETLEFDMNADGPGVRVVGASNPIANVEDADIESCAGPIHIIDRVLLPAGVSAPDGSREVEVEAPAPAPATFAEVPGLVPAMGPAAEALAPLGSCDNVVDALLRNAATFPLGVLMQEVLPMDVIEDLTAEDAETTVLAPPRDEQLRLLGAYQEDLLTTEEVVEILALHVIPQYLPASDLLEADGESYEPLAEDAELDVSVQESPPMMDIPALISFTSGNTTANVTYPDVEPSCSDTQVIHLLDGTLQPEGETRNISALPRGSLNEVVMMDAPAPAPGFMSDREAGAMGPALAPGDNSAVSVGSMAAAAAALVAGALLL